MLTLIFIYLVLPFILSALVIRLIRRHGGDPVAQEIRAFCSGNPIPRKCFRVVRAHGRLGQGAGISLVDDFESQDDAVDAAFRAKSVEPVIASSESVLILNDKGEVLQEA